MAQPLPATEALLRLLRVAPDGTLVLDPPSFEETFAHLAEALQGPAPMPALREWVAALALLVEKAGHEKPAIQYLLQSVEGFFQEHVAVLEKLGARHEIESALEPAKKQLASLSPEPTGPKAQAREKVPFKKPKNVKG